MFQLDAGDGAVCGQQKVASASCALFYADKPRGGRRPFPQHLHGCATCSPPLHMHPVSRHLGRAVVAIFLPASSVSMCGKLTCKLTRWLFCWTYCNIHEGHSVGTAVASVCRTPLVSQATVWNPSSPLEKRMLSLWSQMSAGSTVADGDRKEASRTRRSYVACGLLFIFRINPCPLCDWIW